MPFFLGRKSRGAFGQPAFFLAGNRMTIIGFEKEVSLIKEARNSFFGLGVYILKSKFHIEGKLRFP